jgi:hypothetical protein
MAGAHTDEVFRELGHDETDLAALRKRGVV